MISEGDNLIVGLSGGADSVCLLHILNNIRDQLNIEIHAVHVHHGIRGKDADEDAKFAEDLCKGLGIKYHVYYFNVKKLAKKNKLSEEEMGRKIRYQVFEDVSKELVSSKIAIAHHMNDQAETIIMNALRGTGIKGIAGIRPVRDNIIRPLIECSRKEIEDYCVDNKIHYKEDYTNELEIYTRNKIRHTIIPYIEENFNPNFIASVVNMANLVRNEDDYINKIVLEKADELVEIEDNNYIINLYKFNLLDIVIKRRLIRHILSQIGSLKNIESKHIDFIIQLSDKEVSKKINLPRGIIARKSYDSIIISVLGEDKISGFEYNLTIPSNVYIEELDRTIKCELLQNDQKNIIPENLYTKWLDYDKIKYNLKVRTRKEGDQIAIKGINGAKKIKKYFIDAKIPKEKRDSIPLLADEENIIWIIGYRISEQYKITEATEKILKVTFF
jgi:tRNA(Ile)-lysidine synthase